MVLLNRQRLEYLLQKKIILGGKIAQVNQFMDSHKDSKNFDFYLELSKPDVYDSLVLDRTSMLALALLYQRERVEYYDKELYSKSIFSEFSEDDIRNCLRQVMPPGQCEQHERYNQFIRNLQKHFLWRNEEKGTYRFKDYAWDFFQLMYDRLEKKFEPAYAKRTFTKLIESLDIVCKAIDENPQAFHHWYTDYFKRSRVAISTQVEVVESKVEETVQQLQQLSNREKSKPNTFLAILQNADRHLEILMKNADELDRIFCASATIRRQLDELQHKPYYVEGLSNRISKVSVFLFEIEDRLYLMKRRIRKIQPRIQRLFDVRQQKFDLNTGKFLAHLLKHSQVSDRGGTKQIVFPDPIEEKPLVRQQLTFTHVNKQTFLPPRPIRVERAKASECIPVL